MTFPKRWLEDDDAASAVHDVLRAGRGMDPPEGAQKAVWLALAAQIGAAGAAAGVSAKVATGATAKVATGTGATASAASGGLIKAILIGAFSGIVAVSGYSVLEPAPPPPAPTSVEPTPRPKLAPAEVKGAAPAPSSAPSSAPVSSPPPAGDAREPAPGLAAPSTAAPGPTGDAPAAAPEPGPAGAGAPLPGSPEERASRLREENELLGQARGALRSGDPGRAMLLLEQARQKFPGGVLGQEREALAIEALAKGGARDVASARAAAFIKAHPTSPHAARLQQFVLP
jgi:hypothetical protein